MKNRTKTGAPEKKPSTIAMITIDQNNSDAADIYSNMTTPLATKFKQKGTIYFGTVTGNPNFNNKAISWDSKIPSQIDELVICAHSSYFNEYKYHAEMKKMPGGKKTGEGGEAAGHVRNTNENVFIDQERHVGEYRLDQIAATIAELMNKYPQLHTVKFYACESGQTYRFPRKFTTMDVPNETKMKTLRSITKFKNGMEVTQESAKEVQIDVTTYKTKSIADIYYGRYKKGRDHLTPQERDEYLSEYSNAEIIMSLVDEKLNELEATNKQSHHNGLIIFKAPTGVMDVRKNDPKYRAFDRKDYENVANDDDTIADRREVVPAVRYVLKR